MHDKFSLAKNGSVVVANLVEKKIIYFLLARMCCYGMRVKLVSKELCPFGLIAWLFCSSGFLVDARRATGMEGALDFDSFDIGTNI